MMLNIPGRDPLSLTHVVLDFNGTIAKDGQVSPDIERILKEVASRYSTYIVTSDTFGTVASFAERLGIPWRVVQTGQDKEEWVKGLNGGVVAIGNGANDEGMLLSADLGIAVLGPEGLAGPVMMAADILVSSIEHALELLLYPTRLIATLRA